MSQNSKIEWTQKTWNPVTGCSKVSQGCKNCYAEVLANRFWTKPCDAENCAMDGENCSKCHGTQQIKRSFTDVQCHPDRLEQPLHWRKPATVFVNSMSDLFHEDVPFEFITRVFATMIHTNHPVSTKHTFQILTKRPARALEFYDKYFRNSPIIPNVWLGVSVEDQKTADERIPLLLQIPAAVRFLSCEPLLGEIDLKLQEVIHIDELADECGYSNSETEVNNGYGCDHPDQEEYEIIDGNKCGKCYSFSCPIAPSLSPGYDEDKEILIKNGLDDSEDFMLKHKGLHWVICGGESGHGARPMHPDWARKLRDDCKSAGVPFFFKQWGEWVSARKFKFSERRKMKHLAVGINGNNLKITEETYRDISHATHSVMVKAGKKHSGRLLDGVEWNEFPEVK